MGKAMAKRNWCWLIVLALLGWNQLGQAQERAKLTPFSTDGCSMFMDGPLSDPYRWRHCCVAHDLAYWQGGSQAQRLAADETLRACITQAQDSFTANYVFAGVRWGGHPDWPSSYRWGYGWSYFGRQGLRGYEPLTPAQLAQIQVQMPQALAVVAEDARQHPAATKGESGADVSSAANSAGAAGDFNQKPQKQLQ